MKKYTFIIAVFCLGLLIGYAIHPTEVVERDKPDDHTPGGSVTALKQDAPTGDVSGLLQRKTKTENYHPLNLAARDFNMERFSAAKKNLEKDRQWVAEILNKYCEPGIDSSDVQAFTSGLSKRELSNISDAELTTLAEAYTEIFFLMEMLLRGDDQGEILSSAENSVSHIREETLRTHWEKRLDSMQLYYRLRMSLLGLLDQ